MAKRALITGITGQDGSYLAELLLSKGYEVHGLVRRASTLNRVRIDHLRDIEDKGQLQLHYGDLTDSTSLHAVVDKSQPDEVYNLAAQSHVKVSFETPENTADVTGVGAVRLLEAIRRICPKTRFYQASSSELYGKVVETPQSETTPFYPRSPYSAAKAYAFYITLNYREAYNMFAVNGILFNHESERRGESFVTRKISRAVGRIKHGLQKELVLGNLDAKRDWGHAQDYVDAMWRMLQHPVPEDYVIGTGEMHSIREFLEIAFGLAELNWLDFVRVDPRYYRPSEVDVLCADPSKAARQLGWKPTTTFQQLVERMVMSDLKLAEQEKIASR